MLNFLNVEFTDFMSYQNETLKLNRTGVVLVLGSNGDSQSEVSNGSGKSAMFEAIVWGLFGKTLRGVEKGDLLAVIRTGEESATVNLQIEKDGLFYTVDRVVGKRNTLKFLCDDEDISLRDKRNTQQLIEDTLGLDFNLFCQSVILGQGSMNFATATDVEKKRVLEKIVEVDKFEEYRKSTKEDLDVLQKKTEKKKIQVDSLTVQLDEIDKNTDAVKLLKEKFLENKAEKLLRCKETLELTPYSEHLLEQCETLVKEKEDGIAMLLKGEQEKIRLEQKCSEIKMGLYKCQCKLDEYNKQLLRVQSKKEETEKSELCPVCNQEIGKEEKAKYLSGLIKEENDIMQQEKDEEHRLLGYKIEKEKWGYNLTCILTDLEKFKDANKEYYTAKQNLDDQISAKKGRLRREEEIQEIENSTFDGEILLETNKNRRKEIQESVQEVKKEIKKMEVDVSYYEFWVKGWGNKGLKSYIFDLVTPYLNQRANYYSTILTNGEIEILFSTQKELKNGDMSENFSVSGVNKFGSNVYLGNSSGERQRVDLCIALALQDLAKSRNSIAVNFAVFDEICTYMDSEGLSRTCELLNLLSDKGKCIFNVTHRDELQDLFPAVLKVCKKDSISFLEEKDNDETD